MPKEGILWSTKKTSGEFVLDLEHTSHLYIFAQNVTIVIKFLFSQ